MNKFLINISLKIILLLSILIFSGCGNTSKIFKKVDSRKVPVNVNDRVQANIKEGRGIRFGKGGNNGGTFDFASSNPLWRASIDILDFVPFTNASYSGGILITDWFDGNSKKQGEKRDLKITVRFLTNEIRADALNINIHERKCKSNFIDCDTKEIKSKLESEIKLAILKRATILKKDSLKKKSNK